MNSNFFGKIIMKGLKTLTQIILILVISIAAFAETIADWQLSADGFGPIRIGMTLKEAVKATGMELNNDKPLEESESEACFYSQFKNKALADVWLMVSDNKIVRIDITTPAFSTTNGAHVGDSEAKIAGLYKNIQRETHHYDARGKYLTYKTGDNRAIRFETNEYMKVIVMYAGQYQEVQYVEGCL